MKRILAMVAACLSLGPFAFCQDARKGNGLETGGDLRVRVVVEDLPDDARRIGLDRDALALRCEQVLERDGVTPTDAESGDEHPSTSELHISVNVDGLSFGCAVELRRLVSYTAGDKRYVMMAPVWRRAFSGARVQQLSYVAKEFPSWRGRSHEPGARVGHASYVLDAIFELVEEFCQDLLAANRS
jgi:hypothetical protein